MDSQLQLDNPAHQELALRALKLWLPNATKMFRRMPSGMSGVDLVAVDASGDTLDIAPGTYVLRVGPTEKDLNASNELAAHHLIMKADKQFASAHIPALLKLLPEGDGDERLVASLHQLAGGSLARFAPPKSESTGLGAIASTLAHDLMVAWADPQSVEMMTPIDMLSMVVGSDRVSGCLAAVDDLFKGSRVIEEDGHAFVNPADLLSSDARRLMVMKAVAHNDLHIGNLLVQRADYEARADSDFWIVDADQARKSLAGLDIAYLEVSVLWNFYADSQAAEIARCLEVAEDRTTSVVPDRHHWLVNLLCAFRDGFAQWAQNQTGRSDSLHEQMVLVRIIAALMWARRRPGSPEARVCLTYAGWYAINYNRRYPTLDIDVPAAQPSNDVEQQNSLWESFWLTMSSFAPHAGHYVLIAEHLPRTAPLAALGRLPWSMVIDLDPASDNDGLHANAAEVMKSQRAVHQFTSTRPQLDYARGTAWFLAAGSTLSREASLEFREWVYQRLDVVRQLTASFRDAIGDSRPVVLVLEGAGEAAPNSSRDRLLRVVDAMDEMLRGNAKFVHVGLSELNAGPLLTNVPMRVESMLERLAATVGTTARQREYRIPGPDNAKVSVSPETMQALQEHLVVLHEGIDFADSALGGTNDAFWRGGLISWSDLEAGIDVRRAVNPGLVDALEKSLEGHRTRTVVLRHQPGAGGTTAALRAAWDLHRQHPVAVLRPGTGIDTSRVTVIADRLQRISALTERPVLLIAESSDLSEPFRDALYRDLAVRGSRVTMLYVQRVVGSASGSDHKVSEPLDETEAGDFSDRYTSLTDDTGRRAEIALLRTERYEKYRTPFFFGLITFEREFTKLETYVRNHLGMVRGRVREVLQHLALVTIYSNSGLQTETVQKLMRVSTPDADMDITDLLGAEAARLVTMRASRMRLLHQLIAEQVLTEVLNDKKWEHHLRDLALDFIESVVASTGPTSDQVRTLLRQVFVDRLAGAMDGLEDKRRFAPLIERLDDIDRSLGHQVLKGLTERVPDEPHFWNHLGRHQMYRLERDLDKAEEYVAKAVELKPQDSLHHHTLGLARRSRMRNEIRRVRKLGVDAVMHAADQWFAQTVECFVTARTLSPDNIYAYITHVQAIIDVAKNLKAAGEVQTVAELSADAGEWVAEHLSVANELLDSVVHLYGGIEKRDVYITRCQSDIRRLYNDFDAVVMLWEIAVAGTRSTPMVRRALAQAYYVRGRRRWTTLKRSELERIVELTSHNLSQHGTNEEDYRLWFEAYKLLPKFDTDEALSNLQGWSAKFPSWRSNYYRYCLQFCLWFAGRSPDDGSVELEQQKAHGRTKQSPLWFAKSPEWCPLISENDLGEWNRKENFWSDTKPLLRVNGTIDRMTGPQAGRIKLAGRTTAFFVPAIGGFLVESDEGQAVNFFLGLSQEGPRAWDVQRGHTWDAVYAHAQPLESRTALLQRQAMEVSAETVSRQAHALYADRIVEFWVSLLEAHQSIGDTELSFLVDRARARFRDEKTDFIALLKESGRFSITGDRRPLVYLAGATRPAPGSGLFESGQRLVGRVMFVNGEERRGSIEVSGDRVVGFDYSSIINLDAHGPAVRGQIVQFVTALGPRGVDARQVELLPLSASWVDGVVVTVDELPGRLESDLRAELERRLAEDEESPRLWRLREWIEARFDGPVPLTKRLGIERMDDLWARYAWLKIIKHKGKMKAKLANDVVFGRVSAGHDQNDPEWLLQQEEDY